MAGGIQRKRGDPILATDDARRAKRYRAGLLSQTRSRDTGGQLSDGLFRFHQRDYLGRSQQIPVAGKFDPVGRHQTRRVSGNA